MSELLHEPSVASETPRDALAELRSTRDDFSQFFGDVFDQLQSLSLEMYAKHKCLEAAVPAAGDVGTVAAANANADFKGRLELCLSELRRTRDILQAQSSTWQQTHADLGATRKQICDEFSEVHSIRRQVDEMAGEFSEIKAGLRLHHHALANLSHRVEHHFASLMETLQQQSRNAPPTHGPPDHRSAASLDSAALGTVLTEVELMHQEVSSQRSGLESRRE